MGVGLYAGRLILEYIQYIRLSYCIVVNCRDAVRKSCRRRWRIWKDLWRTWVLLRSSSRSLTADTDRLLSIIGRHDKFPATALDIVSAKSLPDGPRSMHVLQIWWSRAGCGHFSNRNTFVARYCNYDTFAQLQVSKRWRTYTLDPFFLLAEGQRRWPASGRFKLTRLVVTFTITSLLG